MTAVDGATDGPPGTLRVPGDYWREVLAESLESDGSRWSVADLMSAVAGCQAGIVDVAGWLCDEMTMGRVQHVVAWPRHYELAPGVRSYRHRISR